MDDAKRGPAGVKSSGLDLLLLVLIVLGLALRLHAFGFPSKFLFDEHHFVENARNYLLGRADQNDHPPLGKLIIAASMRVLGDTPTAWRAPALVLGCVSIVLGALGARRLFGSARAGWFAAALLSADGFLISYSRAGLLDGYLTCCGLAVLLLATCEWTPALAIGAGVVCGLALGIKFSGVATLVPLLVSLALAKLPSPRASQCLGLLLGGCALTYVASYSLGLAVSGHSAGIADVLSESLRLYRHHAELTDMKNPATSGWSTWFLPARPLLLGYVDTIGAVKALTSLGNVVGWWSSIVVFGGCCAWILRHGWLAALSGQGALPAASPAAHFDPAEFVKEQGRAVILASSLIIAFLAPWILTHRDSYIYHFLPSYAGLQLLLAGFLDWTARRKRFEVVVFFALLLVVAAFYAPLWSFFEVSQAAFRRRLFLQGWR